MKKLRETTGPGENAPESQAGANPAGEIEMAGRGRRRTPIPGVSVLVARGREVVLVRRARPPYQGLWSLPGGRVEWGETLAAAAIREVREETGLTVHIDGLLRNLDLIGGDCGDIHRHYILAVFLAHPTGGTLAAGDDADRAEWTSSDVLDRLDMTPGTAELIRDSL